jgi:anion-transporting  ArsA/GET3 family ATPase
MAFDELLKKKFIVVTGKGGSGKSLVALALAHRLNCEGKRVLLVELGRKRDQTFTRLPELVGLKTASHKPVEVMLPGSKQKIHLSVLDPTTSLAEYVEMKLPLGAFAGLLLNNRVTASFLEVVPGLPDLVSLGKLWHAVTQPDLNDGPDVVVLDAPATGHALALLQAPANFKRITKVGPIFKDAKVMTEFFSDEQQTAIVLTTLPEEMSLKETAELKKSMGKNLPEPFVIVNRKFPELPAVTSEEKESLPYVAYNYSRKRAERESEAVATLKGAKPLVVPFFFPDPEEPALFLRISGALA